MSAAPYKPQPGTIAHKVLAHLHTLAPGGRVNTTMLAEAVGNERSSIAPSMKPAIEAGLVRCDGIAGDRNVWWSLGDGVPLQRRREDQEAEGDSLADLAGPPPTPNLTTRSVFDMAGWVSAGPLPGARPPALVIDDPAPNVRPVPPGQAAAAVPAAAPSPVVAPVDSGEPFGCALWSNGVLMLSVKGQLVELEPAETRELVRYLERMAESVEA